MPYPVGQVNHVGATRPQIQNRVVPNEQSSFEQALERARNKGEKGMRLKFSAHASERMQTHGIRLDSVSRLRLESAVELARSKGIRDSLVVTDQANFIVNIPHASVITIVPRGAPQGDVFTQIDGAVIA
jgi:flagellar operon protein